MKLLETSKKTLQKAAGAVIKAVASVSRGTRDPWYSDDERKAMIDGRERWLGPRRGDWLR